MPDFDQILQGLPEVDAEGIREIQKMGEEKFKDPVRRTKAQWASFLEQYPEREDRIAKFFWIKTKDPFNPLVRFKYNYPQRKMHALIRELEAKQKPIRLVLLKSRQWGGSTYTQAQLCDRVLTYPHFRASVIAHDEVATQEIFDMTDRICEHLPFLPPMRAKSINEIRTAHGSKYTTVTAGSKNQGHGMNAHWIHLSEFSRYPNANDIKTGVLQTVGRKVGTAVIVESTANGMGGIGGPFYELCQNARSGKSDWVFLFIPWHENEDYALDLTAEEGAALHESLTDEEKWLGATFRCTLNQLAWRRSVLKTECDNSPERFKEQYPAYPDEAFLHSGRPVFDMQRLQDLLKHARPPKMRGMLQRVDRPTVASE